VEVMGRQEGGRYRLRFARPFAADLNAALRHLNEYLAGAATGPDRRELLLDLAPGVEVRQRVAQGRIVILDLARVAPGESAHQVEVRTGLHDGFGRLVFQWPVPVAFDALTAGRHMAIRFDRLGDIDLSTVSARLRAWLEDAGASRRDAQSVVRLDLHEGASARVFRVDDHRVVVDLSIASGSTAERAAPPPSSVPRPAFRPTEPPAPAAEPGPVTTAAATSGSAEAPGGDTGAAHLTIASGTDAAGAYLDFAWTRTVGAAVFARAGHLWVVFAAETSRPDHVVVPPMVAALRDDLGPGERVEASGGIALRFAVRRPLAFEVSRLDRIWRIRPIPDAPV